MKSGNFILNLYPMTKVWFMFCISLSVFFVSGYVYSLACFGLLIVLAALAGVLKPFISMLMKTLFIVVILMFAMQALFYPGEEIVWQWKAVSIKMEGILYALTLSAKLLVIGGSIILFFRTTQVKDLIAALEQMGLSKTFSYVLMSTMNIIPQMEKKSKIIMDAQRSRGVETEGSVIKRAKAFVPTIGPLILSSIVATEERAITLEARAFSAPVKKVRLHVVHDTKLDRTLRIAFVVILALLIVRRIVLWIL